MEEMKNYASKGLAGTGLGIAIGALVNSFLNGGLGIGNPNVFGGFGGCGGGGFAAAGLSAAQSVIAQKDSEIAKLQAERYTDSAVSNLRQNVTDNLARTLYDLDKRVGQIETALPLQFARVDEKIACCCNAANAAIAALQNTVAGITKTIVPASAVCPEPMPLHNSWTAPTAAAA